MTELLYVAGLLNCDKFVNRELPIATVYRLHLNSQMSAVFIGCDNIVVWHIARKWGCNQVSATELGSYKKLTNSTSQLITAGLLPKS